MSILHSRSRIATDSLPSLHRIRKHLLYPELYRQHIHGDMLKMLIQTIHNSPTPVPILQVKSHAGIAGNECADDVAKHQATKAGANHADTGMPCAGIDGNPVHCITWLVFEGNTTSDATISKSSNLPAPKLICFSTLHDALKACMHSEHKLGHAIPTSLQVYKFKFKLVNLQYLQSVTNINRTNFP